MANYGDTPHAVYGVPEDYHELFYGNSSPQTVLTVPVQLSAGYGNLPAGTVIARNLSAAGNAGEYVPYNPTTIATTDPGRAFLVQATNNSTVFYVTMEDSYKFEVGDDLTVNSTGETAENLGAISAIDRTTYSHMAAITCPTCSANFLTADSAYVCVEAGASNNYSVAIGLIIKGVDTGTGENAQGAGAQILLSHAIMYTGALNLCDSTAKTALSITDIGVYSVMK